MLAKGETVTVKGLGGALRAPTQPLNSHNDHRGGHGTFRCRLGRRLPALLEDAGAVAKSWPTFFEDMAGAWAPVAGPGGVIPGLCA